MYLELLKFSARTHYHRYCLAQSFGSFTCLCECVIDDLLCKFCFQNMNVDNVSSLLMFAQTRFSQKIKSKCVEFITKNVQAVTHTAGWNGKKLLQIYPSFMLNNLTHKTYIFSDLVKDPAIMTEVVRAMGPRIWRWIILNPYDDELLIPISDKALVHIVFVRNTITTHQKMCFSTKFECRDFALWC